MIRISGRVSFLYLSLAVSVWVTTTPAAAAPPNVDPCTLLTIAEVEQVIGKLKERPSGDKEGDAAWCNYEFANGKDLMEIWVFPADAINRGAGRLEAELLPRRYLHLSSLVGTS